MNKTEIATVGGGCGWCIEAVYQRIDGIKSVTPGYAGGKSKTTTVNDSTIINPSTCYVPSYGQYENLGIIQKNYISNP